MNASLFFPVDHCTCTLNATAILIFFLEQPVSLCERVICIFPVRSGCDNEGYIVFTTRTTGYLYSLCQWRDIKRYTPSAWFFWWHIDLWGWRHRTLVLPSWFTVCMVFHMAVWIQMILSCPTKPHPMPYFDCRDALSCCPCLVPLCQLRIVEHEVDLVGWVCLLPAQMVASLVVELPGSWWQQALFRYVLACPIIWMPMSSILTIELHAVLGQGSELFCSVLPNSLGNICLWWAHCSENGSAFACCENFGFSRQLSFFASPDCCGELPAKLSDGAEEQEAAGGTGTLPPPDPTGHPNLKHRYPQRRARAAQLRGPSKNNECRRHLSIRSGPELGPADTRGVQDAVRRSEDDRLRILNPNRPCQSCTLTGEWSSLLTSRWKIDGVHSFLTCKRRWGVPADLALGLIGLYQAV
jgi:hypothetical protein